MLWPLCRLPGTCWHSKSEAVAERAEGDTPGVAGPLKARPQVLGKR